jgi:hypothetical protein
MTKPEMGAAALMHQFLADLARPIPAVPTPQPDDRCEECGVSVNEITAQCDERVAQFGAAVTAARELLVEWNEGRIGWAENRDGVWTGKIKQIPGGDIFDALEAALAALERE